jgi:ubiquinone/menaquinone biosynthesis C-methylase UbiE
MSGLNHRHVVSIVRQEAAIRGFDNPAVLDAGCGDGALLALLSETIPSRRSGFDSAEYGLQSTERIGSQAGEDCEIRQTNADRSWPFNDEEFDIVVSNQVLEHVDDLKIFCAENARVLKSGGFGVHVFPLRHMVIEPHMRLPLVHRVRDHDLRASIIAWFSKMGLGIYRSQAPATGVSLEGFANAHADYARTFTTYRTWRQVCEEYHRHGFRVSYRHTSSLVQRGLWRLLGHERAGRTLPPLVEASLFPVIRSLVSCTLVVQKNQDYRFTWKMDP